MLKNNHHVITSQFLPGMFKHYTGDVVNIFEEERTNSFFKVISDIRLQYRLKTFNTGKQSGKSFVNPSTVSCVNAVGS